MCSGTSRRASKPAWTPGCRVLTRPSRISGKPVRSVTGWTSIEASSRARIVPPVEYSSWPSRLRPRAKAGRPALLWTERRARLGKDLDRFRQDTVLLGLDAGLQSLDCVVRQHRHRGLNQDRAGEGRREARAEDPVVAGVDDQLDPTPVQPVPHRHVACLARDEAAL